MAEKPRQRLLLVEDDPGVALMLSDHLEETLPVDVTVVDNAEAAVLADQDKPYDIVLTDLLLPDANGLQLVRRLRMQGNHAVILMSGQPTLGRAIEAMRLGCLDLLTKPFDLSRLTYAINRAIEEQNREHRERIRQYRLRKLTSRIVKDRRRLRERVDLVCRDLVRAYRELAKKVVETRDESNVTS